MSSDDPSGRQSASASTIYIWHRITPRNNRIIRDKLRIEGQQLREDIKNASAEIRIANRLNLNKSAVEIIIAQVWEQKVDEHAGKCYEIFCRHWNLLGETKTGAFVRVVLGFLQSRIKLLARSSANAAKRSHKHKGSIGTSSADSYETFGRAISDRLKAKLDIEARELDLTASIERAQEHSNPRLSLTGHSRNPAAVTSPADPVAIVRPGEIVTEIGPLSSKDTDTTTAAVEMLQRLGFGAEKQDWPSPLFGPILPGVLEQLKRARRILTTKGFLVVGDPLNPLGDGRSWVLRFEPTEKLPTGADFAELADQYLQSQGITVAAKPVQDGRTFLVALWDSDRVRRRETRSKREAFVARNKRTMVDSDFWRDLAAQFLELRDTGSLRAGEVNDSTYIALETLAKRGASKIASAGAPDLLAIWLEELRREGFPSTFGPI